MIRPKIERPAITIDLFYGGIEAKEIEGEAGSAVPVDVIAVGHYRGVHPSGSERALDQEISRAILGPDCNWLDGGILAQFSAHGVLPGSLGRVFVVPDPRDPGGQRLIAIAGMGLPGGFGAPELTLLVQQLCWTVGLLGKRHLATTLIGAGTGNLSLPDAVYAWTRGIRAALTGRPSRVLEHITFVNDNPSNIVDIDQALQRDQAYLRAAKLPLDITYRRIDDKRQDQLVDEIAAWERKQLARQLKQRREQWRGLNLGERPDLAAVTPTRLSVEFDEENGYQFRVITEEAAVPVRMTEISRELVLKANAELEHAADLPDQLDRGRFLSELLFPDELREVLTTNDPIVLALDTDTALVHWEMLAVDPTGPVRSDDAESVDSPPANENQDDSYLRFLGTSRGFTRQLRTTASPLDLPPPARRTLRVLVVGDPAADAPLQGAMDEATLVADLFDRYNEATPKSGDPGNDVEVKRLLGPEDATRTNVLRELINNRYDVLHFAGHCQFNRMDPTKSGWLFHLKDPQESISAAELRRVDRIPKFVFSNACESGVMADRHSPISVGLGPSFAESFFTQGVANFICTAWKVDDYAATVFARTFYAGLLGLELNDQDEVVGRGRPEPIVTALRDARVATAGLDGEGGVCTWGAYQHYGNPLYTLFARSAWTEEDD